MFEVEQFCFAIDLQELFKLYSKERQTEGLSAPGCSGESTRLPPTYVACVQIPASTPCGLSLLLVLFFATRGFSLGTPVFPSPQKPTLPTSNSISNARTRFNELLRSPKCSIVKQITKLQNYYFQCL